MRVPSSHKHVFKVQHVVAMLPVDNKDVSAREQGVGAKRIVAFMFLGLRLYCFPTRTTGCRDGNELSGNFVAPILEVLSVHLLSVLLVHDPHSVRHDLDLGNIDVRLVAYIVAKVPSLGGTVNGALRCHDARIKVQGK